MLRYKVVVSFMFMVMVAACQPAKPPFECKDALGCVTIAPDAPIKIGSLQVVSGGQANLGEFGLQAIGLALTERDNRLLGHPIVLQNEDEGCTPEGGANAALKLVADPQIVGIIGTICSSSAINAAKIMSEAGLVMISGANTVPALTGVGDEKGANWQAGYFRTIQNAAYWGDIAATFVSQKLGVTKAATIHDNDAYAQALTELFSQKFTALGGEVVLATSINRGDKDMLPILAAVAKSESQFIFYPIFQPEADYLTIQTKDVVGLEKIQRMVAGSVATDKFIKSVEAKGIGMYVVVTAKPSGAAFDKFRADFKAKYNTNVPHFTVPYTYDATNLLLKAIEQVVLKDDDNTLHLGRQALRDALYTVTDFQGATGEIHCNKFGDCNIGSVSVLQLNDPATGLDGLNDNVIFSSTLEKSK